MKTKLFAVVAALLLSVVATSVCYAQQTALTVTIPFAFQAGNQTMPAGEYRVESVLESEGTRSDTSQLHAHSRQDGTDGFRAWLTRFKPDT
jgi:hypothetical protein